MSMKLGNRMIDTSSIVIGTHILDPDNSEVWYTSVRFTDGDYLTGYELDELYYHYPITENMIERYGL
jgi:hypothetical protein